jgi:hypothetical protein
LNCDGRRALGADLARFLDTTRKISAPYKKIVCENPMRIRVRRGVWVVQETSYQKFRFRRNLVYRKSFAKIRYPDAASAANIPAAAPEERTSLAQGGNPWVGEQ